MLSCSLKTCGEFLRLSEGHFQIAFQEYDGSSLYSQLQRVKIQSRHTPISMSILI